MRSWITLVRSVRTELYTPDNNGPLVAGQDAVSAVLEFILRQLSIHQDVQSRLRLELLTSVSLNRKDSDFATIDKLVYLNAVVMESLRLVDTVSLYQTRVLPKGGCIISGTFLPSGVSIRYAPKSTPHNSTDVILYDG